MYRIAVRSAARPALRTLRTSPATRRFASTNVPADRPRSWKSSALRWGLVGGAIYYYNTSPVFADEAGPQTVNAPPPFNDSELPTVDSVLEEKRRQIQSNLEKRHAASPAEKVSDDSIPARTDGVASGNQDGPQGLEEQAGQEGAFNPETGEINWDCPCLGGMAHGPCGEDFKTAFSCFVYSEEEPKGMDCIDKFQSMQDCFRQYPEIYGAELEGEDAAVAEDEAAEAAAFDQQSAAPVKVESDDHQILRDATPPVVGASLTDQTPGRKEPASATSTTIPAKWDDAREANFDADKKENPAEAEKKEEEKKQ